MSTDSKNIIKIASIIVGTIVGAGFASGQEILQFFTIFDQKGLIGIILASFLFFIISFTTLELVYRYKFKNYRQVINSIAGEKYSCLIENVVMIFLLFSFFIMIAGASALFKQFFGLNIILGATLISCLCFYMFHQRLKGVVKINEIIAPILIISIGIIGIFFFSLMSIETFNNQKNVLIGNWFTSWISYVGYNSIGLIALLTLLFPYITNRKVSLLGSIIGTSALCFMAFIIFTLTKMFFPLVLQIELPMLEIIQRSNLTFAQIYSFVLLTAMLTSAVTSGFCFLNKFTDGYSNKFSNYSLIICLAAIPMSCIGFSNLIAIIYPLFGYLGFLQVILIIRKYISTKTLFF